MATPTGSSINVAGAAQVIKEYQPRPESPPRAALPTDESSSLSSAPLPGSLAPPAKELSDSVVCLGAPSESKAECPPSACLLQMEDKSADASPAASPTGSVLSSSGPLSLDSPEKAKGKPSPAPDHPPAARPRLRSESLSMPTPTGSENPVDVYALSYRVAGEAYKIIQHFVIRSPHVFIAITTTFLTFKYINEELFAWEAATYVGVASAVYCIIRPLFLMLLPYSLLPRKTHDFWRHAINTTNTIFITISLTSAVWGLKISGVQGTAIWGASFVLPYKLLSKHYPDLDGQFPNSAIKEEQKKA